MRGKERLTTTFEVRRFWMYVLYWMGSPAYQLPHGINHIFPKKKQSPMQK